MGEAQEALKGENTVMQFEDRLNSIPATNSTNTFKCKEMGLNSFFID